MKLIAIMLCLGILENLVEEPRYEAEQIFPVVEKQTHAPGIVELANGDLLASWYGDAEDADAAVLGARKSKSAEAWSDSFVMADRRGFPDCNTCMMIDGKTQLWLFWPTIVGSSWESCLMNYRVASNYQSAGSPKWDREGLILLKPNDFADEAIQAWRSQTEATARGDWRTGCATRKVTRSALPTYGLGATMQANSFAKWSHTAPSLYRHICDFDHGYQRRRWDNLVSKQATDWFRQYPTNSSAPQQRYVGRLHARERPSRMYPCLCVER